MISGHIDPDAVKNIKRLCRIPVKALLLWAATVITVGCFNERFTQDENDVLAFSTDTLSFDTVLTEISTVTRFFKIYNPNALSIRIEKVSLEGANSGFFRLNVDGYTGEIIQDMTIRAHDSIYVFVEATIDPDLPVSVSPFFIEAEVMFFTNGHDQRVKLVAWGQNANYIPGPDMPNRILVLSCDLGEVVWNDPRPYVLYGTLLIDSCTLVLPAGTRLYVHGGIANNELGIFNEGLIYTLPHGRLQVNGTPEAPVIIRDDRIEPDHDGDWAGIRLGPGSGPHTFSHMQLTRALAGIIADSASTVNIDHSIFTYTGGPAFFGRHAKATITNCLFYGSGGQAIALTYGGEYDITYCTLASFGNPSEAMIMNNFYCTDPPFCTAGLFLNKLTARVTNSILVGSSADEFWIVDRSDAGSGLVDIVMQHNILTVDKLATSAYPAFFESICTACLTYTLGDTLFADLHKSDFHLDSLSMAIMKALPVTGIIDDLEGKPRDSVMPDIGCYEW